MSKQEKEGKDLNSEKLGHVRYDLLGQNTKKQSESEDKTSEKIITKPREEDLGDSL